MLHFLFYLLCLLSLIALVDGLRRREGIFEFQTLFAGAFLFSTVPQLFNYVFRPGRLPDVVYRDHGPELAIVMSILCLSAGWVGYRLPFGGRVTSGALNFSLPVEKMFWAGTLLCCIGLVGAWQLAQLAGGFRVQFLEGAHYQLEWRGAPVLYSYIARLILPGLALCWVSTLAKGSVLKWTITGLGMVYPVAVSIFLGRRGVTFSTILVVLYAIWFQKRWAAPRSASFIGIILAGIVVILTPAYRANMMFRSGSVAQAVTEVDFGKAIDTYLSGEVSEGMDHLVIGIPARLAYRQYGYGGQFWNELVDQFVPGQFVGYEFKKSLSFPINAYDPDLFLAYCGYPVGSDGFLTGPYSVFVDFSFFGFVIYYFIARLYKRLWILANQKQCSSSQMWYIMLCYPAIASVVNSVQVALAHAVFGSLMIIPVLFFLRSEPQNVRKRKRRTRGGLTSSSRVAPNAVSGLPGGDLTDHG